MGFFIPRWTTDPIRDKQGLPFRSILVASALYNAGYEVVWFDEELDLDRSDRRDELRSALADADLALFWMNELDPLIQTQGMLRILEDLGRWYPSLPVAAGGEFITVMPADALQLDGPVDHFIRGYGEQAVLGLLDLLEGRGDAGAVSGLVTPDGTRAPNAVTPHQHIRAEDTSLYRRLDMTPYIQRGGIFGNDEPTLMIGSARGCAKGCGFCYWTNHQPSLLDAATIVDLAEHLRDTYGVRQFHLAELDFFANRTRPRELVRLWRKRIPDCRWFTLGSPIDLLRLDDDELDDLARGGCHKIEMGTETGSPRMLAAIGKRHRPDDPLDLTRKLLDRGIATMHNFIFGFVGETEEDRQQSLDLIRRLHDLGDPRVTFTFRFFQPLWGTPMGDAAIDRAPDYPRRLDAYLAFRASMGERDVHTMPWIEPDTERRIKDLTSYFLPMVTSRLAVPGRLRRLAYRFIRKSARLRLHTRFFGLPLDRWAYGRFLAQPLDCTYTP